MKQATVYCLIALALLALAACSSNEDKELLEPMPLVDFKAEKHFKKIWSASFGDGQGSSKLYNRITPSISGDKIAGAGVDGRVKVLTLEDGDTVWSEDIDRSIVGGVGFGFGLVVVGCDDGHVVALDAGDGSERWDVDINAEVLAPALVTANAVIVQAFDGRIIALSITDGSELWSYRSTVPVLTIRGTSTPIHVNDMVVAGFANGKVIAFDEITGLLRWELRVASAKGNSEIERMVDIDGEMLAENKVLYVVSYQGALVAIDPGSGRRLWSRDISSYVGMGYGFGNVYVSGDDGTVTAFINNGQGVRWTQSVLTRRRLSAPVTLGSYVVVADFDGYLHAMSQVDGHMIARKRADSDGVRATMLAEDGRIYVFGNSGKMIAYEITD